ncbi:MAG: transposase [Synergistaceae bacterium]|nr:transposase [Synergistaceae bacterium]
MKKYRSFTLKQYSWSLDEANGKIRIGQKWYRYFKSRNIEGKVKTVTVKCDLLGDIYVYLCCDIQCEAVKFRSGKSVGLDFGLKKFLTASDGNDIESPDFFALNAKYISTAHRKISRKKIGSGNFERARLELSRAYKKLTNQRKDFHFKLAHILCSEYAVICLEDLNVKAMLKRWGRKIQSLGFSYFVKILLYEAEKFGTRIIFIDRFYPSSQTCSECGYKNKAVKNLNVREWDCPKCKAHHDRDRNAAKNILRVGMATLLQENQCLMARLATRHQ